MKRGEVFEVMEPPLHGLTRLRAAIEERRKKRAMLPVLAAAAVAVLIIVKVDRRPNEFAEEINSAMASPREDVTSRGETAVEALPSSSSEVIIYRVASRQFQSGQ